MDTQDDLSASLQKHLLVRGLPLLGTSLLLYWLFGGFPPSAWRTLLLTIVQGSRQGMGSYALPIFLLSVQSIFVMAALGMFFWLLLRESIVLYQLVSPIQQAPTSLRILAAPALGSSTSSANEESVAPAQPASRRKHTSTSKISAVHLSNPFEEEEDVRISNPFEEEEDEDRDVPVASARSLPPLENPFFGEEEEKPVRKKVTAITERPEPRQGNSSTEKAFSKPHTQKMPVPDAARPSITVPVSEKPPEVVRIPPDEEPEEEQEDNFLRMIQELRDLSAKLPAVKKPALPPASKNSDLAAAPSIDRDDDREEAVLPEPQTERNVQDRPGSKLAMISAEEPIAANTVTEEAAREGSSASNDPFDVQDDVLEVFLQEASPENATGEQTNTAEQPFLYGDPFEGPLPDVFQHDEDLKRSLREQLEDQKSAVEQNAREQQASKEQQTSNEQAEEKPNKKPYYRKRHKKNT